MALNVYTFLGKLYRIYLDEKTIKQEICGIGGVFSREELEKVSVSTLLNKLEKLNYNLLKGNENIILQFIVYIDRIESLLYKLSFESELERIHL